MREKSIGWGQRRATACVLGGLGLMFLAAPAGALSLNLELRQLHPEINPFARTVYLCSACTLADWENVVPPAGFEKSATRIRVFDSASVELPTPSPGTPPTLDLLPEIPGDEFEYVADVLGATLVGYQASLGFMAVAQVQRETSFTYEAGRTIHEVVDDVGNRYVLFTIDYGYSLTHDLDAEGALASLALPVGWSYSSRTLDQDLVIDSGGLATVFSQGTIGAYQRYSTVPEPGTTVLLAAAGFWARRRRRAVQSGR